jgi:hypothetical protein
MEKRIGVPDGLLKGEKSFFGGIKNETSTG